MNTLNGLNGFIIPGLLSPGNYLGASIMGNADINGDSITDLFLGAPEPPQAERSGNGTVYVIFGKNGPLKPALKKEEPKETKQEVKSANIQVHAPPVVNELSNINNGEEKFTFSIEPQSTTVIKEEIPTANINILPVNPNIKGNSLVDGVERFGFFGITKPPVSSEFSVSAGEKFLPGIADNNGSFSSLIGLGCAALAGVAGYCAYKFWGRSQQTKNDNSTTTDTPKNELRL